MKKLLVTNISEEELPVNHWRILGGMFDQIEFKHADEVTKQDLKDTAAIFSKFNEVSAEMISDTPNLKYIGVFATGYGKVDMSAARANGVVVTNIPGYSTESVAEFTLAIILEHLRELSKARAQANKNNYSETGFNASEVKGKNFGIVGLGQIGTRVAELSNAFGSNVSYWSKSKKSIKFAKSTSLNELLENNDIISLHLALNQDTEGILDSEKIARIRPGSILVNTSPMEIIDFDALVDRLEEGDITFMWDHPDEMPEEKLAKLTKFENCVTYPPIGYITEEASMAKKDIFVGNVEAFVKGESQNVVS